MLMYAYAHPHATRTTKGNLSSYDLAVMRLLRTHFTAIRKGKTTL